MTRSTSGPAIDAATGPDDPVAVAFARARDAQERGAGLAGPPVRTVHRSGARLRRLRRGFAVGAAAATVASVVGLSTLLPAGGNPGPATRTGVSSPLPTVATVTEVKLPAATGRSASGLLEPADLGSGWTSDPIQTTTTTMAVDQCAAGGPGAQLTGVPTTVTSRLLRGSTPEGSEWIAHESVGTLRTEDLAVLEKQLAILGRCPRDGNNLVLAASPHVVVTGTLLDNGSVGMAKGYLLVGQTLISLDTLPGGAIGGVGLPEQTPWMLATLQAAAVRATGRPVAMPEPNAAAVEAAAKYVRVAPDQVIHVQSDAPGAALPQPVPEATDPIGQPTVAAPTVNDPVPAGFLTLADLGPTGAWSVSAAAMDRQQGNTLSAALPTCGSGTELSARGKGVSQMYRGWLEGTGPNVGYSNEWIVNQTVLTLDRATLAAVKARLTALAGCRTVTAQFGELTTTPGATKTRVVAVLPRSDGGIGVSAAWLLVGDRLAEIDVLPGGAAGNRGVPGGQAWLDRVVRAVEGHLRS